MKSADHSDQKCRSQLNARVVILGAGFAGIGAAKELAKHGINDFIIIGTPVLGS